MPRSQKADDLVVISREIWEWAKASPAFAELIEVLEDLEDMRQAKKEKGGLARISDVIERYEKLHKVKLDL